MILNRREFLINFDNQNIKIIDKKINKIVVYKRVYENLYKLIMYISNKTFLSQIVNKNNQIINENNLKIYDINNVSRIFIDFVKN